MSSAAVKSRFTPEQYLALERKAAFKSEYFDGCIRAMAGASRAHNLIALNLGSEIRSQLRDRPCETYVSDMRVRTGPSGLYTYPDVVVVCGEPRFEDDELDTLLNPTVIVEVLSPSTEAADRGRKFASYRRLASLQEYVLVAQDRACVERYTRQGDEWLLTELERRTLGWLTRLIRARSASECISPEALPKPPEEGTRTRLIRARSASECISPEALPKPPEEGTRWRFVLVCPQCRRQTGCATQAFSALNGPEDVLWLASIGCEVALSEIYAKVPLVWDGPADGV